MTFLANLVTEKETWVYIYYLENNKTSKDDHHSGTPLQRKFHEKDQLKWSSWQFFELRMAFYSGLPTTGSNITVQNYSKLLGQLKEFITYKRRWKMTKSIILLHDNANPHTSKFSTVKLKTSATVWSINLSTHQTLICQTFYVSKLEDKH